MTASGTARVGMGLLLQLLGCSTPSAHVRGTNAQPTDASASLTDPAKHAVNMVEVAPEVSLEILDYGGDGSAVIFLAGLGFSGHVFDDFAPRLTDRHHVYAITRRGYGASSKPDGGYDVATRVADDLAVLTALGLERAIWIGHSLAGDELTALGATHASRVAMLVYLDATTDHGERLREFQKSLPLPEPDPWPPPVDAWRDPVKLHAWLETEVLGCEFPFGETLAKFELVPNAPPRARDLPTVAAKLIEGSVPHDFAAVRVPALVLVAPPDGPEQMVATFGRMPEADQQAWRDAWPKLDAYFEENHENVRLHLTDAEVVMIRNSHHMLFVRSADEVLASIRAFVVRHAPSATLRDQTVSAPDRP